MKILIESIGKEQDKFLKSIPKGNEIWCCENNLKNILPRIFPNQEIIYNKNFILDNFLFRPDFRLPEEKIIIEFHGY